MKTTLKKLVEDINAENAPPGGWSSRDRLQDKPEAGKYTLLQEARARAVSRMVTRGQSLR